MYACINVLTELMYFQQILYLHGVNKYYGYGSAFLSVYIYFSFHSASLYFFIFHIITNATWQPITTVSKEHDIFM